MKKDLYTYCVQFVDTKLTVCKTQISKIQDALQAETKSTAGDKYETSRAMLHLEREKLGHHLATITLLKKTLSKIDISASSEIVCLGSVVYTNESNYFIAISAGTITIDNTSFFAISPNTPIGKLLLGKKIHDTIVFKELTFTITNIE